MSSVGRPSRRGDSSSTWRIWLVSACSMLVSPVSVNRRLRLRLARGSLGDRRQELLELGDQSSALGRSAGDFATHACDELGEPVRKLHMLAACASDWGGSWLWA